MFALTAVLPLPKTSHDMPMRGVMSLYELTPSVRGNVDRRRQERRRPFRLFGIPARRTIEAQRPLQRQVVVRPLILREERVPAAVAVVLPRSDELA